MRRESGKRKVSIEIEAAEEFFYLTDALSREGVLKELKAELKVAIRDVVLSYVQKSKDALRLLRSESKPKKKSEKE